MEKRMEKKLTKRQNEIVDAALHLIAEKGMGNLTIRHLSRRLNVTDAALYYHFHDKLESGKTMNVSKISCGEEETAIVRISINIVPLDELPHVLRRGMDAVFRQLVRDCPSTFSFSPQGKDLFPEREQNTSSRSMFHRMPGESADDIKLFRAVVPVFGRFAFKFAICF